MPLKPDSVYADSEAALREKTDNITEGSLLLFSNKEFCFFAE